MSDYPELTLPPLYPPNEVTDADLDALSRQIRRQEVGDSLSVRVTLKELSLDKRLRQPPKAKASSASSAHIHRGLPQRTRR